MKKPSANLPMIILAVLLGIILIMIIVYIVLSKDNGNAAGDGNQTVEEQQTGTEDGHPEKWQEGIISYKGRDYQYNDSIHTYLMMGIDKNEPVSAAEDYISGGQSDAMFLLVTDADKQTMCVIAINRNTMTEVQIFDTEGRSLGTMEAQICVAHGYGDGKRVSCGYAVDAVSGLFGDIPIEGYFAMNMGGIPIMNDAIGGVEVEVLHDLTSEADGVELHAGEVVTLSGNEAYYYLHGRDCSEFASSDARLLRQQQYIDAYTAKLKQLTGSNPTVMIDIYNSIDDYMVTNLDFVSVASELMTYTYDADTDWYSVPGETVMGEKFEEYHVDEDALEELIIQVFYEEAEKQGT